MCKEQMLGDPVGFIGELECLGRKDEIRPVLDYVNAKAKYDGMIQCVRDDIDGRIAQSDAMVDGWTNREAGMIQGVRMKAQAAGRNDRRAYLLGWNVVRLSDGTDIDHGKSRGSAIVRYEDTGEMVQDDSRINWKRQKEEDYTRHSWGTIARGKDVPLSVICEALGHDSEATTQIYLDSIKSGEVDKANRMILEGL